MSEPAPADSAPVAADSGNNAETIMVTGARRKADKAGFSNASKASGQSFKVDATQTITRITQREILEAVMPIGTISNAISNQPNVITPTTTSPIVGGNIYIRGFSKGLLNITLDGIPMNLIDNYTVYTNQLIPLGLVGSVDIKPGAGSASTIGYSNFGGSIDVNSASPSVRPAATVEAGYGSFNEQKYGVTLNSGRFFHDTTSLIVNFNRQAVDGYFDKGSDGSHIQSGKVPSQNQVAAKLVSQIGPGVLTGLFSYTDEKFYLVSGATANQISQYGPEASVYTGPSNRSTYWGNNLKKEHNSIGYIDYTVPITSQITFSERPYYWDQYTYTSSVPTAKPYSSQYSLEGLSQAMRYGNIAKLTYKPLRLVSFESGLWTDYTRYTWSRPYGAIVSGVPFRPETTHVNDKTTSLQPYFQATFNIGNKLTITPGFKFNYMHRVYRDKIASTGYDKDWRTFLPSLGLNYIILGNKSKPTLSLYANYTRSYEPPSFSQISTAAENFTLDPQFADSFEAGPMWDWGRWSGKISLFDTHFLNYIRTINISNAANPNGVSAYSNAGGATYQGVDISNSINITKQVSIFANIGLLDAHFSSLSTPIPYAAHNTDAFGVRYQGSDLQIGASFQYNSGYFVQTTSNVYKKLTPFFTANLFATYKLPLHVKHIEDAVLSVNLDNAFNRSYIVDGGSYSGQATYNYALPINVFADIKVRFN
ncbi:TonB-dependent receptor [Gluconobacter frateurii M-2]|nr:TonB-dependent receptor [Gluconobacter frateurii M-2]